jgi:hypothetical protein
MTDMHDVVKTVDSSAPESLPVLLRVAHEAAAIAAPPAPGKPHACPPASTAALT